MLFDHNLPMPDSSNRRPEDMPKVRAGADASAPDAATIPSPFSDFVATHLGGKPLSEIDKQLQENSTKSIHTTLAGKLAKNGMRSEAPTYNTPANEIDSPFDSSRKNPEIAKPQTTPLLEHPRFESGPPANTPAETFKLKSAEYGSGQSRGADVVVRVPENFDPSKPMHMVVYNHGFYDSASTSYNNADLNDQMRDAPPNTVLVVPEWQTHPADKNSDDGKFGARDQFKHLVNEAFSRIPELKGKTLDSVDAIHLISHSAGYKGLESELYRNGIENKVKSITMLDSMYNPTDLDPWLHSNIRALANGDKQFVNISNPGEKSTYAASRAQAMRVKEWLAEARLGRSNLYEDYDQTGSVVGVDKLQKYPMVFKLSEVVSDGKTRHMSLPNLYVHRALQADDF